jgi:hypothetical protein
MDLRETEWDGMDWIDQLRITTSGGGLLWTFGFHKKLGSSWVAAQLAASQEGLSSMSEWWERLDGLTKFCSGNLKGRALLEDLGVYGRLIWKWILRQQSERMRTGSFPSGQDSVADPYELGTGRWRSERGGEFLE